jgi:SAM-dependent methyltransferase
VGAGRGELVNFLRHNFNNLKPHAVDFHVERFAADGVEIKQADFDRQPLPYADRTFDLVTCTEVLEHVENYRGVLREIFRVLKPGGVVIVSTPNVLNAVSRSRTMLTGFANLFGPLPVKRDNLYSTGQHIMPIPYFYLAHAMLDADFLNVKLSLDKVNHASIFHALLQYPFILIGWPWYYLREKFKYKTITPQNKIHVRRNLSPTLMLGRTIIVGAEKHTQ